MKALRLAYSFLLTFGVSATVAYAVAQDDGSSDYNDRALNSPKLNSNNECPVSSGDNSVVSPDHGYIFGAGGYFFGSGPVYLALSWKPWDRAEAYFELDPRTLTSDGYRLKTPWIMHPEYKGEALIRGAQIGTDSTNEVLFRESTQAEGITANMILQSEVVGTLISAEQRRDVEAVWGFWPSSMILSKPGCYAIQIDTEHGSDTVVFEAIIRE
jgi:hypothetical protein